jgi:hypothetical protein
MWKCAGRLRSSAMCDGGTNHLMMQGPGRVLEHVRAVLAGRGAVIDFARLLPPPPGIRGEDRRDWCVAHWGVSATPRVSMVQIDDAGERGMITYSFSTGVRAPVAFVSHLSACFPQLDVSLVYRRDRRVGEGRSYSWSAGRMISVVNFDEQRARVVRCGERRAVPRAVLARSSEPWPRRRPVGAGWSRQAGRLRRAARVSGRSARGGALGRARARRRAPKR